MFRVTTKLTNLALTIDALSPNYTNLQVVRWGRKPIWLPTAKSKLFRVSPRIVLPDDEREELKRLYNNYRTQIKSIRRYLTYKYSVRLLAHADIEQLEKAFIEDFAKCKEINDKWNAEVKVHREKRVVDELERDVEYARNRLASEIRKKEEELAQAEEIVQREKKLVGSFITRENLDAAIEYAINNPVDHNFAIDLEGNKIIGRETKPSDESH